MVNDHIVEETRLLHLVGGNRQPLLDLVRTLRAA